MEKTLIAKLRASLTLLNSPVRNSCFCVPPLWCVVEPYESGEEETMETLVAADSLLNMECSDALSLEHYSESTHEQTRS